MSARAAALTAFDRAPATASNGARPPCAARTGRTAAPSVSIRSSDRVSVAEGKIEELQWRLQKERIARLRSENELEALKRQTLEQAIASAKASS